MVFGYNINDLAEGQLATGKIPFVYGSTEALFVTEVDERKCWMVSDVPRAGAYGGVGVMGIEWSESPEVLWKAYWRMALDSFT